jgi:hypothetical protein
VTQTTVQKATAIASVLWLLEDHHRMIAAGRTTPRAQWISAGEQEGYRPPFVIPPDPHDPAYPDEAWCIRQRYVSRAYRLWPISLKLQALWREKPAWAQAVESLFVNIPQTRWIDLDDCEPMAVAGLLWMAHRVPGDVPLYSPAVISRVKEALADMHRLRQAGLSYREIARQLDVSKSSVHYALKGRPRRTADATS